MSCAPNRTAREQRMLRAIAHAVYRNHANDLACHGCLELLGFASVEGFEGNTGMPVCAEPQAHQEAALTDHPRRILIGLDEHIRYTRVDGEEL